MTGVNEYSQEDCPFQTNSVTFTFMHLADAFIQSDLQCIQVIHVLSVCNCNRWIIV